LHFVQSAELFVQGSVTLLDLGICLKAGVILLDLNG